MQHHVLGFVQNAQVKHADAGARFFFFDALELGFTQEAQVLKYFGLLFEQLGQLLIFIELNHVHRLLQDTFDFNLQVVDVVELLVGEGFVIVVKMLPAGFGNVVEAMGGFPQIVEYLNVIQSRIDAFFLQLAHGPVDVGFHLFGLLIQGLYFFGGLLELSAVFRLKRNKYFQIESRYLLQYIGYAAFSLLENAVGGQFAFGFFYFQLTGFCLAVALFSKQVGAYQQEDGQGQQGADGPESTEADGQGCQQCDGKG